jgi:hypothetical protein
MADTVIVNITGTGRMVRSSQTWQVQGFLLWLAGQAGSSLTCEDTGEFRRFTIEIARAG